MKKKLLSFILAICMLIPCSLALTACGINPPDEPHTHSWATTWSKDSTHHWYDCDGCEDTKDKATHTLVDGVCSVCEYDTNHTHEYGTTYLKDSDGHWQKCQHCDNTTTKATHTYSGNICSVCGYENQTNNNLPVEQNVRDLEVITIATTGGGTATLVELPDGKNMLIGAGADDSDSEFELDGVLYDSEITTIDYLVLTNTSDLRIGGADMFFDYYEVKNMYKPTIASGITPSSSYNTALNKAANEIGCTVSTIEESNLDIDYSFKDIQGNTHNYKIDFILPVDFATTTDVTDATVVVSIEYQGKRILIGGDATINNIDGYCTKYGTQKNVDVLITSYVMNKYEAIANSYTRGSDYLNKISLDEGDYCVVVQNNGGTHIDSLFNTLNYLGNGVQTISSSEKMFNITEIKSDGSISVNSYNELPKEE